MDNTTPKGAPRDMGGAAYTIEARDGGLLSAVCTGHSSGTTLVLLHGLGMDKDGLAPLSDLLDDRYRTVRYDLRGHGDSPLVEQWGIDDHAADLLDVLADTRERFGGKAGVVGFSMGSYVALRALGLAGPGSPELPDCCILLGAKGWGKTSSVACLLEENGLDPELEGSIEIALLMLEYSFSPRRDMRERVEMFRRLFPHQMTPAQKAAETAAWKAFDVLKDIGGVDVPALVLTGEDDRINPPARGRAVARALPRSQYCSIPGAGHMLFVEQPDTVRRRMCGFLEDLGL